MNEENIVCIPMMIRVKATIPFFTSSKAPKPEVIHLATTDVKINKIKTETCARDPTYSWC